MCDDLKIKTLDFGQKRPLPVDSKKIVNKVFARFSEGFENSFWADEKQ